MDEWDASALQSKAAVERHAADEAMGKRIRAMRNDRSLSLTDLAARTGFSVGHLSQIERGLSSPSLRALVAIADSLGVGLYALFDKDVRSAAENVVMRRAERKHLDFWRTGVDKEILTRPDSAFVLNMYLMTLEPEGNSGDNYLSHSGEEAGLVLSGQFELDVDGHVWTLGEGDSFRFASVRCHRYRNPSSVDKSHILWSLYTPAQPANAASSRTADADGPTT